MDAVADERRLWLEAWARIAQGGHAEWLREDPADLSATDQIERFSFYGLGVMPNDAQCEAWRQLLSWPEGTVHLWEMANRTGKTTGVVIAELWAIFKKWRYSAAAFDDWWRYTGYKALHAAPLGKLTSKAWELAEAIIGGTADQQRSKITGRYRPTTLLPLFKAGASKGKAGDDQLWVKCANNAHIDFMSTQGGAGRLESDNWYFLVWDEFARQQPVSDVPLLFQQTFLPRSSDFMAPIVLSGTSTEDADPVYAEMAELAERTGARHLFNSVKFGRSANFAMSQASTDRQRILSVDQEIAQRSIDGGTGGGGKGPFPKFLLDNLFDPALPPVVRPEDVPKDWVTAQSFDHGIRHDDNVLLTVGLPWPPLPETLMKRPITGLDLSFRRSSRTLTPDEQFAFMAERAARYDPMVEIIDATAEGGLMVYRQAKAAGLPARACSFTSRTPGSPGMRIPNKEYGIQALQRLLSWGLPVEPDEEGWISDWSKVRPTTRFGLMRLPLGGNWVKLGRQLALYRRGDVLLKQDAAMTMVMFGWWLYRYLERGQASAQRFSVLRSRTSGAGRRR